MKGSKSDLSQASINSFLITLRAWMRISNYPSLANFIRI